MRVRVIGGELGCLLRWRRNDRRAQLGVGCEHAMGANQMQPREAGPVQLKRCMNSSGDITIWVVPSR